MELLAALALFCVVTLFTPGPNNLMLMTSGLNFGFRRGLPHLLGVTLGFTLMVLIVGLGLGAIFEKWPLLYTRAQVRGSRVSALSRLADRRCRSHRRRVALPRAARSAFCRQSRSSGSIRKRG